MDWTLQPADSDDAKELCPYGSIPAVVVGVIDVGTHTAEVDDDDRPGFKKEVDRRRLALIYQLVCTKADGSPFIFWEELTASLHERATLLKRIKAIVGETQTPGDLTQLLGRQCSVSIVHNKGKKGERLFANMSDVGPVGYGAAPVQPARQPILWRHDSGQPLPDVSFAPRKYGETIASLVASSHEAKAGKIAGITVGPVAPQQPGAQAYQQAPQQQAWQPQQPAPPEQQGFYPVTQPPQQAPAPQPQQASAPWTPPPVPTQFAQPGADGCPI